MKTIADPVKAEITRNALVSAAREMHDTLIRSAYNPLIFDVKDFGVTILSADGDMWADAPGLPVFVSSLPETVRSGIRRWGKDGFRDGDVLIANCPYLTGTHLSDTAVYMPVFHEGALVAFTATMAHWADIGGMSPGGWTVDSTEIYQEGLRFTNQRLHIAGEPNVDLLDFIEANVRVSHIVMGDLHAQIATCLTGARRVQALCDRYDPKDVTGIMGDVLERTESALRQEIAALPDGRMEREVELDFDGVDRGYRPRVAVQVAVEGDRLTVTFDGTSRSAPGPINIGEAATLSAAVEAVKGILDPLGPTNEAHLKVVDVTWPEEATLVNPGAPSPCDSYGYVGTGVTEMIVHAMTEVAPHRGRASSYQMVSDYVLCTSATNKRFVFAEPVMGGHGAWEGHDGETLVFTGDGDTLNTPVEVMESRYPIRCEEFALNTESAGPGEFRGGMGVKRDIRVLQDDCMIKTALECTKDGLARGLHGGEAGDITKTVLTYPSGEVVVQYERVGDFPIPNGTIMGIHTGGGGGYGHPLDRDPARVLNDVDNDILGIDAARTIYGVHLNRDVGGLLSVDARATERERAQRRESDSS
ncbi:hydantoinase B/oxoprolinase family protein [Nonomuraea longispora]|uniref:Hydantoinase B/oxoprolinase family protein n=1 Tax=Nonomuraea longispora TaxID=1848320 RepID=A0A4R4NSN9_9ACTN|nr:hydantoinase B/oxoprolinase family protein [Nonomuraea longispora]TDC11020.1 hydantoinase B/oxoprolinase family protein [Nonomuraea longispora]